MARAGTLLDVTSSGDFFALVDQHVTGPMTTAGYSKIGDYDHLEAGARGRTLVMTRSSGLAGEPKVSRMRLRLLLSRRSKGRKERVLEVGYEGTDPDGEDDEKWLRYYPETDELNLRDWEDELGGHADWDVWNDHAVSTTAELERRLHVVGVAMRGRSSD